MPYTFAHPAATLLLVRPMGRFAVPSALVLGSIVPDLWHFAPLIERAESHNAAALLWFCAPVGLALYVVYHRLLKEPLIALLPRAVSSRLGAAAAPGLPAVPWLAVIASLLAGALTHLAWDGLIQLYHHIVHGFNWPRHASTALGTAVLSWWIWRWLRQAPVVAAPTRLSPVARTCTFAALAAATAVWACSSVDASYILVSDFAAQRDFARALAIATVEGLCLGVLAYCICWQLRTTRQHSPR